MIRQQFLLTQIEVKLIKQNKHYFLFRIKDEEPS